MIRTQIYIPAILHAKAKIKARNEKTSLAEILRKSLQIYLDQEEHQEDFLSAVAKLQFSGGPKDLSEKFDEYLYGNR